MVCPNCVFGSLYVLAQLAVVAIKFGLNAFFSAESLELSSTDW